MGLIRYQGKGVQLGYCHCGCGQKTNICRWDDPRRDSVRGQPLRFIKGHQRRGAVIGGFPPGTQVDPEFEYLAELYTWRLSPAGYVRTSVPGVTRQRGVALHRLITGAAPGELVDHINHDKRDNRLCNLRVVDAKINSQNRRGATCNSKSGRRNVYPYRGGWLVSIQVDGRRFHVGQFTSIEEADLAAREWRKKYMPGAVEVT